MVNVKSVFYTYGAFAAHKEDGSVVVWGSTGYGGDAGEKQSKLTDVIQVVKTKQAFAARRKNGEDVVWGNKVYHLVALMKLHQKVSHIEISYVYLLLHQKEAF